MYACQATHLAAWLHRQCRLLQCLVEGITWCMASGQLLNGEAGMKIAAADGAAAAPLADHYDICVASVNFMDQSDDNSLDVEGSILIGVSVLHRYCGIVHRHTANRCVSMLICMIGMALYEAAE